MDERRDRDDAQGARDQVRLKHVDKRQLIQKIEEHEAVGYRQVGEIGTILTPDRPVFAVRMELP